MALHKDFPTSPYAILDPAIRWFPADEAMRASSMEKLLPPLVSKLRKDVAEFRRSSYEKATSTSRSLLNWWFNTRHLVQKSVDSAMEFEYYFAQREAIETIIYLHDVAGVKDKYDMMRFDTSGMVRSSMFDETWRRFVIKMATGSGKTKVLSLVLVWSYFHKLYEPDSSLARNFLVIAPNIIVLDRIYKDFQGLRIFYNDPVLPDDGYEGQNWRDDFQLTLHIQDEVHVTRRTGNIFLTNIHRVYSGEDIPPSPEDENTMDYFLGKQPTGATTDSKVDLGMIVRDISELVILNDEAHHIHDNRMAWFKSIEDIHNRLLHKGASLAMQIDTTATPRHNKGAIFVQTVADYPLVEAIAQNIVKHPVLPDAPSRAKLLERKSARFTEKYADYLELGVIEWRKAFKEHEKLGKKAILFVMTDDTRNCDEVAEYLEERYQDLKDSVLVIHTKNNGEISESSSGKDKDELNRLRNLANEIDNSDNRYKAIVSVMMLKEGWDVRNVTTIVGLRAYSAKSNILPEQTLGRGLRRMYSSDAEEYVSVIGTHAFMEFVESIQAEGVVLEQRSMGEDSAPNVPLLIEVDRENTKKNIEKLDITIPVLSPRIYREYKQLSNLDVHSLSHRKVEFKQFSAEEQRSIIFREITSGKIAHTTQMRTEGIADYRSVIGHYTQAIMKDLRLVSGYDVLYGKVKSFVQEELFDTRIALDDPNTIRNLSENEAAKTLIETLKSAINALTIAEKGDAEIRDYIKLRQTRPFIVKEQGYMVPKKSLFNRIIGDSGFELQFALFLDDCDDVQSYAKNFQAVHFRLDYVNHEGDIKDYYPDFIVKQENGHILIVETKGHEDLDVPLQMARLAKWCDDINRVQGEKVFDYALVDEESFKRYKPKSIVQLIATFRDYKR